MCLGRKGRETEGLTSPQPIGQIPVRPCFSTHGSVVGSPASAPRSPRQNPHLPRSLLKPRGTGKVRVRSQADTLKGAHSYEEGPLLSCPRKSGHAHPLGHPIPLPPSESLSLLRSPQLPCYPPVHSVKQHPSDPLETQRDDPAISLQEDRTVPTLLISPTGQILSPEDYTPICESLVPHSTHWVLKTDIEPHF